MSALGHKRTYALHNGMSALLPTATEKADISPELFDYLISLCEH